MIYPSSHLSQTGTLPERGQHCAGVSANPQNLNRYSYVNNSPLMYTDPTGHELNETQGNGGCSTSGFCPRDYDFTPEPEEDGDGGGGGGGGGGKPEDNPKQDDDQIICATLANGEECIEKSFSSYELAQLTGSLYDQSNQEYIIGGVLVIAGLVVGAIVTVALAAAAAPVVGAAALLAGAGIGLALALGTAGALIGIDGALLGNTASQIGVAEGANTEIAYVGDTNFGSTIAAYGDASSVFTSYSPTANTIVLQYLTNP